MSADPASHSEPQATRRKAPGILMLALSFVPWAVYWMTAAQEQSAGVLIALGLSCALLAEQVLSRNYRVLDVASLVFFVVAALSTYLMATPLFIAQAGPIGFAFLLAIAIGSLAVRRPFSSDAARNDYPRQYWRNSEFLTTHSIVTTVWGGAFLVCGLIVTFSATPLTSPILIGLLVVALVFTVIFQSRGQGYLIQQRSKPYEWHIPMVPGEGRQQDEYDVAVVGAGIGGLTAAALLSKEGYKVLVMEQQPEVGGYCGSFTRDDFTFSTGVLSVGGVWDNGPVVRILDSLGLPPGNMFAPHTSRVVYKGQRIDLGSGAKSLVDSLATIFPEDGAHIAAFFQDASEAFYQLHDSTRIYGSPLPDHLAVQLMGERAAAQLPRSYPALYDWTSKSFGEKLDEYFQNANLKALLASQPGQNGIPAGETPGLRALIGAIGPMLEGGYYPTGGPQNLANILADTVTKYGGTIKTSYRTDRILTDRRQVRGVRSGEEIFQAHVVVANANARTCALQLLEANEVGGPYIDFIKALGMSRSAFMVYAGIEADLSGYPSIITDIEGDFTILINSNVDPRLAPRGRASLTMVAPIGYRDFPSREERDYDDRTRQFAALLVRKAEEVVPEIAGRIAALEAATPRTLEERTAMPEGAMYGFDQSIKGRRPHFRAPIKGLYFVGASTFPGAGIESAMISASICANDIRGWKPA